MAGMNRSLHVCEVIHGIGMHSGGTGSFISDLSYALPANGWRFSLLTQRGADGETVPIHAQVRVAAVASASAWSPRTLLGGSIDAVLNEINARHPLDAVHSHGVWLPFGYHAGTWARAHDVPYVVSPHGTLEPWAMQHKRIKKAAAWRLYQRRDLESADAFHACSDQEAEGIRRLGLRQPIATIPNGTVLPQAATSGTAAETRSGQRVALFLGRVTPIKGLPMLIEAWSHLAPRGWRLVIAGNDDGGHTESLRGMTRQLGLDDAVEFRGPVFGADKDRLFRAADLFVLPSYSENFGIVVAEALSHAVPVLTTTGCPWKELVSHRCGWWVEPTPVGIRDGLAQALATPVERRNEMGARGRDLVEQRYQWPAIAEQFRAFYRWLGGLGEKPAFVM